MLDNPLKQKIKIYFVDFWTGFNKHDNMFMTILKKKFDVEISEDPDFIIYSDYGWDHLDFKCVRFYYTGENISPDFNVCDYAIGNDWIIFEDRYLRWPTYRRYSIQNIISKPKRDANIILSEKKYFCNFIYTDGKCDSMRGDFFKRLCEYKMVDSMGSLYKNKECPELSNRFSGDWIQTKINVIRPYKFTIAFENSVGNGYTTQKLVHAMQAETIPIYWGNPRVDEEFNPDSFIWVRDGADVEDSIEKIIKLDQDNINWTEKMSKPWVNCDYIAKELTQNHLEEFFYKVFSQDPIKAKRRYSSLWKQRRDQILMEGRKILKI